MVDGPLKAGSQGPANVGGTCDLPDVSSEELGVCELPALEPDDAVCVAETTRTQESDGSSGNPLAKAAGLDVPGAIGASASGATTTATIPRDLASQMAASELEILRGVLADPGRARHKQLVSVLNAPEFASLPVATRINILAIIASQSERARVGESSHKTQFLSLAKNPGFLRLNDKQQREVLEVCQHLTPKQQRVLGELLGKQTWEITWPPTTWPPPKVPLVTARGGGRASVLDSMFAIATGPFYGEHGMTRGDVLGGLVQEINTPGAIDQHSKGTCTVTTMQYMLALENPAEYARLVAGLASPSGAVRMRGGGTLERVVDSVANDGSGRTASERLFQAALMDYANEEGLYSNIADETIRDGVFRWDVYGGLRPDESERALQALFGRDFRQVLNFGPAATWSSPFAPRLPDIVATVTREAPVWAAVRWGDSGHAILVTEVKDGRVYFRNPWGAQPRRKNGSEWKRPSRRMEDNSIGLESMTVDEFRDVAKYGFVES